VNGFQDSRGAPVRPATSTAGEQGGREAGALGGFDSDVGPWGQSLAVSFRFCTSLEARFGTDEAGPSGDSKKRHDCLEVLRIGIASREQKAARRPGITAERYRCTLESLEGGYPAAPGLSSSPRLCCR